MESIHVLLKSLKIWVLVNLDHGFCLKEEKCRQLVHGHIVLLSCLRDLCSRPSHKGIVVVVTPPPPTSNFHQLKHTQSKIIKIKNSSICRLGLFSTFFSMLCSPAPTSPIRYNSYNTDVKVYQPESEIPFLILLALKDNFRWSKSIYMSISSEYPALPQTKNACTRFINSKKIHVHE